MASSPSHKFGQIIGDLLEDSMVFILQEFADEHHLYLDKKGIRHARSGTKVTWVDSYDNKHDRRRQTKQQSCTRNDWF